MYNWLVPKHAKNADAAQEFLLHYTENFARATWESELYDFPAFEKLSPKLDDWLDDDPFGSKPANKLAVLKDALDWTRTSATAGRRTPRSARCSGRSSSRACTRARPAVARPRRRP